MIGVIDIGISNLKSIRESFLRIGVSLSVCQNPESLDEISGLVLPGVGSFSDGMQELGKQALVEPIREFVLKKKKPLLGICLGMQLLADNSDEYGQHEGLGLIHGSVIALEPSQDEFLPNMGWSDVDVNGTSQLMREVHQESFYFAHSFHFTPQDKKHSIASFHYGGQSITAAVESKNIYGVQFHPEKSQDPGLRVIQNFTKIVASH